jgi:hypothetical protein
MTGGTSAEGILTTGGTSAEGATLWQMFRVGLIG